MKVSRRRAHYVCTEDLTWCGLEFWWTQTNEIGLTRGVDGVVYRFTSDAEQSGNKVCGTCSNRLNQGREPGEQLDPSLTTPTRLVEILQSECTHDPSLTSDMCAAHGFLCPFWD